MNAIIVKLSAILLAISGILATLAGIAVYRTTEPSFGSAPSGLAATPVAFTSVHVGPSRNILLYPKTVNCAARIITTSTSTIMLKFATSSPVATSSVPFVSEAFGFFQNASTTAVYDSGLYGCPAIAAYGLSTSTVMIYETQ